MLKERLDDLSVYYYIKDLFTATPFINIEDGFPVENLTIPTVSIEAKRIDTMEFQLGSRNRIQIRAWYIDVFAQNKSQRDEIAYTILNALEECIPVYNYNEGFPPSVSPSQLGCLETQDIRMDIIRVMPQLVNELYYRATVMFTAIYNEF
jgi:hypothetical protein